MRMRRPFITICALVIGLLTLSAMSSCPRPSNTEQGGGTGGGQGGGGRGGGMDGSGSGGTGY